MRVFRSLEEARGRFGPCALSIGNFDGVHRGHQQLFAEVVRLAADHGRAPSVLTFHPHPTRVVAPERAPRLLYTIEERCRWMAEAGITQVLILPFDASVASLSPDEFVHQVIVDALGARAVVVGDNFRFGNKQAGDVHTLSRIGAECGFEAHFMQAVKLRGAVISSSEIRKQLLAGNVARAARLLGRFYAIEGKVVKGRGVGARQTVPTLNIETVAEVVPATGVYISRAADPDRDRSWPSITNIGYRPTFGGNELSIETFLLRPLEGDSPTYLRIELTHRIREERRFENAESLKAQILRDVSRAQTWHRRCTASLRHVDNIRGTAVID